MFQFIRNDLIPELCRLVKIKTEGNILEEVKPNTPLPPIIRYQKLMNFFEVLKQNDITWSIQKDWGLSIDKSVHTVQTDNLPPTWNNLIRGSLLDPVDFNNKWLIVYMRKDRWLADGFVKRCQNFAQLMSLKIAEPRRIGVNREDTESYLNTVKNNISHEDRIVVVVTPGSLQIKDRYDAIKQYCTEVRGIPTQFVRAVTLDQPRKIENICSNILVQMTCKAGGVPWSVEMPLDGVMYIGVDVFKGTSFGNGPPTMGFVASSNSQGTRWFSKVSELANNRADCLCNEKLIWAMQEALYNYKKNNGTLPRSIVIYRKEGTAVQWRMMARKEWPLLCDVIRDTYKHDVITNISEVSRVL